MNSKQRPIIMSSPMIRALLEDRKTQTRRLIKGKDLDLIGIQPETAQKSIDLCRFGKVGDLLWVREKIYCFDGHTLPKSKPEDFTNLQHHGCDYAANIEDSERSGSPATQLDTVTKTISPIFMFHWCRRIELVLTEVSIERVGDISGEDAIAEGLAIVPEHINLYSYGKNLGEYFDPIAAFRALWNSINDKPGTKFADNPWVWVLKFERFSKTIRGKAGNDCNI